MDMLPFWVVVSVILVVTDRVRVCDASISSMYGPDISRRLLGGDLSKDLLGEGGEQIAQHLLIRCNPLGVGFVGRGGLFPINSDFNLLGRRWCRAVDEAFKLGASDGRHDLRLPQREVVACQLLRDPDSRSP